MRWSSAIADDDRLEDAVENAAAPIIRDMAGYDIDLLIVFVSHHFAPHYEDLHQLLHHVLPHVHLLGCSAGGVIGGRREVEQQPGISLTAAHLPEVNIVPIYMDGNNLPDADASPRAWSEAVGVDLEPTSHFILLADPFSFPAGQFLDGLDYAYPRSVKVGGLASGAREPGGNSLYLDDKVARSGMVGMALQGNIAVETIVAQGCRPVGNLLRITRAQGHVLMQLEGKPALEMVHQLIEGMNEEERQLASQALFVGMVMDPMSIEPQAGEFLIRNIVGVDPDHGALAIGENLEEGQLVQFHLRDAHSSAADLDQLLSQFASSSFASEARGALLFSCLGRGIHLYNQADHDTGLFHGHVQDVPLGGFFCNGEIGPVAGSTHLHGFTSSFGIFAPIK